MQTSLQMRLTIMARVKALVEKKVRSEGWVEGVLTKEKRLEKEQETKERKERAGEKAFRMRSREFHVVVWQAACKAATGVGW